MQRRDRKRSAGDLINKVESENQRKPRPLIHATSRLVITISFAILAGLVISQVAQAFVISGEVGIKSFAAAVLPPLIITYFTLFSQSSFRPPEKLPLAALYFAFAVWMIALLLAIRFVGAYFDYGFPLGVLLASITFSGLIFLARHIPLPAMVSCSYGVLSGSLLYMLLFGLSVR
jgi:hypothetical protein